MMRFHRAVLFTLVLFVAVGAASAQDILIRGAKVHTVSPAGTLDRADVLIHDGKIAAVGKDLSASAGATIVEAKHRPLTPGLCGGISVIGLMEIPQELETVDTALTFGTPAWQQQWRPEFDVTLAFNPRSALLPVARIEGVTWAELTPAWPMNGDNIVAGQGAAVTLDGRHDALIAGSRSLFVDLGDADLSGGSRAGHYMLLEQAIEETRSAGPMGEGALLHPAGRRALASYLAGGRIVFRVNRAADIRQLIGFAQRHGIKAVIQGGAEAWSVADELAHADIPVILDPLLNLPYGFDGLGARIDNAVLLKQAGVRIAFTAPDPENLRKIRQLAGNAVAHGLSWDEALAAITATPAEIFGLHDRGRIEPGQVADLVLWSGDPLEVTSVAEQVWIAGAPIEMHSRQTELRDRYLKRIPQ